MKHPACTPQVIPGPEPITTLNAALDDLEHAADSSKYLHLSPAKATALNEHIYWMGNKLEHSRNKATIYINAYYELQRRVKQLVEDLEA